VVSVYDTKLYVTDTDAVAVVNWLHMYRAHNENFCCRMKGDMCNLVHVMLVWFILGCAAAAL
jgi:hypothetical protein